MLIDFRQGIYRQQDTRPFLVMTTTGVDINVDDSPTTITLAHGNSNYLFTEDKSIRNAWNGPFSVNDTTWLYWDIDLTTGSRTFGYTTVNPDKDGGVGNALPSHPQKGQHFFLISENKMKYFTGRAWKTVLRVFAGSINKNASLTPYPIGTQVNRNLLSYAGYILFNSDNIPIKKSGLFSSNEFMTTETRFSMQNDANNNYKIENVQINGRAIEPVPKFHCVCFKGPKLYGLASRLFSSTPCVGIAVENLVKDSIGKIVTHGIIENKDFWNFVEPSGTSLWIGETGEVTASVPQNTTLQKIGYVVNSYTIYVDVRQSIMLTEIGVPCFVTPDVTSTNTPTPTPTPPVTATLTPTPTITPTTSIVLTLPVTPTATVTPTTTVTATVTPTTTVTATVTPTTTVTVTPTVTSTVTPTVTPSGVAGCPGPGGDWGDTMPDPLYAYAYQFDTGTDAVATLTINPDGTYEYGEDGVSIITEDWSDIAPGETGSNFEVRWNEDFLGGGTAVNPGTQGTWLNLGTARTWTLTVDQSPDFYSWFFSVTIRPVGRADCQVVQDFVLEGYYYYGGGGGGA